MMPSENPFKNKLCRIFFKENIIYRYPDEVKGKLRNDVQCHIQAWLREGIILDDGGFTTWSTVSGIYPVEVQTDKLDGEENAQKYL